MPAVRIKRKKATGFENVEDVIQIKSPKAKDPYGLVFTGEEAMESIAVLVSRCSSLTKAEIDELDSSEYMKLVNQMNAHLEGRT
jgi:hypothetical protein